MKRPLPTFSPVRPGVSAPLLVGAVLTLALAVSACSKQNDAGTAGQQLDAALAKAGQAAEQAKEQTESALAGTSAALKDATQNAEFSAKVLAGKAGEKLDDLAVTTAVLAGLTKDPDLSILKIKVDSRDGAVTLSGSAPTQAARDKASELAKAVQGVKAVDNRLLVGGG